MAAPLFKEREKGTIQDGLWCGQRVTFLARDTAMIQASRRVAMDFSAEIGGEAVVNLGNVLREV